MENKYNLSQSRIPPCPSQEYSNTSLMASSLIFSELDISKPKEGHNKSKARKLNDSLDFESENEDEVNQSVLININNEISFISETQILKEETQLLYKKYSMKPQYKCFLQQNHMDFIKEVCARHKTEIILLETCIMISGENASKSKEEILDFIRKFKCKLINKQKNLTCGTYTQCPSLQYQVKYIGAIFVIVPKSKESSDLYVFGQDRLLLEQFVEMIDGLYFHRIYLERDNIQKKYDDTQDKNRDFMLWFLRLREFNQKKAIYFQKFYQQEYESVWESMEQCAKLSIAHTRKIRKGRVESNHIQLVGEKKQDEEHKDIIHSFKKIQQKIKEQIDGLVIYGWLCSTLLPECLWEEKIKEAEQFRVILSVNQKGSRLFLTGPCSEIRRYMEESSLKSLFREEDNQTGIVVMNKSSVRLGKRAMAEVLSKIRQQGKYICDDFKVNQAEITFRTKVVQWMDVLAQVIKETLHEEDKISKTQIDL